MRKRHYKNSPHHRSRRNGRDQRWAGRLKMKHIRKIIELHALTGLSVRQIKDALNLRKSTVSDYLTAFKASNLT